MLILQWTITALLGAFACYVIIFNWTIIAMRLFRTKRAPSLGPIVGGIAGAVALLLCPFDPAGNYWWVPIVVDPGCGLMLAFAIPAFAYWGLRGDFRTEPICPICEERIVADLDARMADGRGCPENPEPLPELKDGVCPVCGFTKDELRAKRRR